jgi:group I intron endonuclease
LLGTPDRTISSEASKMKNLIYKITNTINNKMYIGQTTQGLLQRQREHVSRFNRGERDHKLYLAFRKYGIDAFKFEVICVALDASYLNELEVAFIAEYNSYDKGYNMTVGGDTVSEETRQKLSSIFKGRKITWYDKIVETKRVNGTLGNGSKTTYKVQTPNGILHTGDNLNLYCKEQQIDYSNLLKTLKRTTACKGYVLLERSTTSSKERRD